MYRSIWYKRKGISPEVRFWSMVDRKGDNDCWLWLPGPTSSGYGTFCPSGKTVSTHRYAWEITNGKIPDRLEVCHSCDVKICVNPAHLFLGTQLDNIHDMYRKHRNRKGTPRHDIRSAAKITEQLAAEVIARLENGETQKQIAKQYGLKQPTISDIKLGKTWGSVTGRRYDESRKRSSTSVLE